MGTALKNEYPEAERLAAEAAALAGASLTFGDFLTYATDRLARQPLLYIGTDFSQADLAVVPADDTPSG